MVQQIDQPSWLDRLQREQSQFNAVSSQTSPRDRPAPPTPSTPLPLSTPSPRIDPPAPETASPASPVPNQLDSQRGEGTYLVLMTYQGEEALARARQVSAGAFLKTINGQQYIQLAAFNQIEHARYMADDLRQRGYSVQVLGG